MATPMITTDRPGDDEPDQPARDTQLLTVCAAQYERWGWMVLRAGERLLLAAGDQVSAVEIPAALGAEVQHHLAVRMLAAPVIMLPGTPRRWLLLTGSADRLRRSAWCSSARAVRSPIAAARSCPSRPVGWSRGW